MIRKSLTTSSCIKLWRRRRGTAEIELLLSAMVLISLLLVVRSAMKIALGRMGTTANSSFTAIHNATAGSTPQYIDDQDLQAIDGVGSVRPGLPSRMHVPRLTLPISVHSTNPPVHVVNIGSSAAVAGPPWIFSAYPVPNDQQATQQWFLNYVDDSHSELIGPLLMAPAWTP